MRNPTCLLLAALATWTATVAPSEGGVAPPAGLGCVPASRPAATLLLPYFEIDLADPAGRNTLFSVNNAASSPRVAHAVVWTNRGVPVLSFDLALPADGVRSINLRSVLAAGSIVETSLPPEALAEFPGCATPLVVPDLGGASLTELQDRLRGQGDDQGDCVATPVEGGQVITGFVTVDVVSDCSGAALRYPGAIDDPAYFVDGGLGLATNDNVLWGDYFLIDSAENSAQGLALVPILADAERFGIFTATFYQVGIDNRASLGNRYRARYLRGGGFDGGTDMLLWIKGGPGFAQSCQPEFFDIGLSATFRDEAGAFDSQFTSFGVQRVLRLHVGDEPWPAGANFGTVDVSFESIIGGIHLPFPDPEQGLVVPILTAEGRFSVGYEAVQLEGFCP